MNRRLPLPEACTGDDWCPISEHIKLRGGGHHRVRLGHIDLTKGQRKTLAERAAKAAKP